MMICRRSRCAEFIIRTQHHPTFTVEFSRFYFWEGTCLLPGREGRGQTGKLIIWEIQDGFHVDRQSFPNEHGANMRFEQEEGTRQGDS
ncbi:hypothetical protein ACROYT_G006447 [Oculina patagonica]